MHRTALAAVTTWGSACTAGKGRNIALRSLSCLYWYWCAAATRLIPNRWLRFVRDVFHSILPYLSVYGIDCHMLFSVHTLSHQLAGRGLKPKP